MRSIRNHLDPVESVLRQLADLIEPYTRFDRNALRLANFDLVRVPVSAVQTNRIEFATQAGEGNGKLASGIHPVANATALQSNVDAVESAARNNVAPRLRQWLSTQATLPGSPLTVADCFDGPYCAGFEWQCGTCRGNGQVTCPGCRGNGQVTCDNCYGSGKTRCSTCSGSGETICGSCGGRGSWQEQQQRSVYDSSTQSYRIEYYWEPRSCYSCGSRGRVSCSCFNGKVSCSYCFGSGNNTCNQCSGRGQIYCSACAGSGWRHQTATLTCTVKTQFTLQASTSSDEARARLQSLRTLDELCSLTRVTQGKAEIDAANLTRHFAADMELTFTSFEAAGRTFDILCYGAQAQVYDFKNIVGSLLQGDLDQLQSLLQAGSLLPWQQPPELADALANFLRSEVNQQICEIAGAETSALHQFAEQRFKGAVSNDYAERSAQAGRQAVHRLLGSEMYVALAITACLPAAVAAVFRFLPFPWQQYSWLAILASGLAAGFLTERRALGRLKLRFDAAVADRVIALVHATHSLWWWRAGMTASALLLLTGLAAVL